MQEITDNMSTEEFQCEVQKNTTGPQDQGGDDGSSR